MMAGLLKWIRVSFAFLLGLTLTESLHAIKISPSELTFDARLDEAVILTLEVDQEDPSSKIDITVDGFICDRRVTDLGGGKFRIEIAPETMMAGSVRGKIQVQLDGQPMGNPIPLSGNIRPWMNIRPAKIFLGSIGHGEKFTDPKTLKVSLSSDTEPFDITSVDFREIKGASWQCEPEQGTPSATKILSFTFTSDAVAAGLPFGALAKKFIVIRTTHPNASICSIPVTGMLSVNTTGRDYSTFLYKSQLRWQGPWPTPNIAAAFISMALLLLCGLGGVVHNWLGSAVAKLKAEQSDLAPRFFGRQSPSIYRAISWIRWGCAAVVFSAFASGCYLLARTYSRGGWVAMTAGIAVLVIGTSRPRLFPLALAGVFALSILINPAGLSRATSMGAVDEDKSISNRLLLWQGALQMMAEHPWKGVGKGKFGDVFMREYQLPTHTQTYSTAINDFLTVGTERGIMALAITISMLITLVTFSFVRGWMWKDPFLISCSACITSGIFLSWFSSIAFESNSRYPVIIAAGAIVLTLFVHPLTKKGKQPSSSALAAVRNVVRSTFAPLLVGWLGGLILIMTFGLAMGGFALKSHPLVEAVTIAGVDGLRISPRTFRPVGTIVYLGDQDESPSDLLKSTLRPLAKKGWKVYCFQQCDFLSDTQRTMTRVLNCLFDSGERKIDFFLAGHARGAVIAENLSRRVNIRGLACFLYPNGVIILSNVADENLGPRKDYSFFAFQEAKTSCIQPREVNPTVKTVTYPGSFSAENPRWQDWIRDADRYLFNLLPPPIEPRRQ